MSRRSRGFTMIELMVTVAIVAVLVGIAGPNMAEFIDRQRLVAQTLAISELAQTARSEATKRSAAGASELKSIAMTITAGSGSAWGVGLANGIAACSVTSATCKINQGGTEVPFAVTATQCEGCSVATTTAGPVVFDLRGLVTAQADQVAITVTSPKSKQLRVRISPLGSISICSPSASVTGYPSC